ncbi:MAG: PASTA domain-containing protein [Prevotellaceae bacterium]|jgi:cell division protein FtsI (penicillin-binding protein 3)|nr:PASTA domain-containing protein [Prevotellaceae bacterium]
MIQVNNIIRRITLFYLVAVVLGLLIIGKMIYLQFFTDLKTKAEKIKKELVQANRGDIYTHDMKLLAISIPMYEVRIDFYAMKTHLVGNSRKKMELYNKKLRQDLELEIKKLGIESKKEIKKRREELNSRIKEHRKEDTIKAENYINSEISRLADSLANLFQDKNANAYRTFIKTSCEKSRKSQDTTQQNVQDTYRDKRIGNRNINCIERDRLLNFPVFKFGKGICGLIIKEPTRRVEIYDSLARSVIGNVNSNGIALSGIEKSFDKYIKGKDGLRAIINGIPINSETNVLSEAGCDVVTTLDLNIQETVVKALMQQINEGNRKGIAIEGGTATVMETETGEIRAMVNMKRNSNGTYNYTHNYALMERSDPGSTFKLASLVALLDDEFVKLDDVIDIKENTEIEGGKMVWTYKKFKVRDDHLFGKLSVRKIIANSSNIGTAKLVTKYYGNNPQKFFDKLHSIGLFQKSLNLQIAGELSAYAEMETQKQANENLLAPSSYGYYVKLAPIHTLAFYNAIANNGKMMKPKFVKAVLRKGQIIKSFDNEIIEDKICSDETLAKAREALQSVVDSGTSIKKYKDALGFEFAGKTGTAQRITSKFRKYVRDTIIDGVKQQITDSVRVSSYKGSTTAYQASFVGYVPVNKPRYSIIVVLYSEQIKGNFYGIEHAVPVFVEIAKKLHSSDINWYEPVKRNDDSLYLPKMKNSMARQVKTITSKLDLPVSSDAKSGDWLNISNSNSKLTTTKIQIDDSKVPSVINMGLRNAVYLLEKLGLKVVFSGKGKIKRQSISPGTEVSKGATIYLELEI